jgi:hypothetical protein
MGTKKARSSGKRSRVRAVEAGSGWLELEDVGGIPGHRVVPGLLVAPNNLHTHNRMDLQGLLYIEYGFHLTLMTAGLLLAYTLLTLLRPGDAGVQASGAASACVT